MIGNFIADHIRGNHYKEYSNEIQQGVFLHRAIDTYTDAHAIVRKSKRRLHKRYGHYNGVIIDVFYDYFLAKNWASFSEVPLKMIFCCSPFGIESMACLSTNFVLPIF